MFKTIVMTFKPMWENRR